jgi:site-specific recombinase XerD
LIQRLFHITHVAVNKRIDRLMERSSPATIKVTPHTFCHSFVVNANWHGTPLTMLQGCQVNALIEGNMIYTRVL